MTLDEMFPDTDPEFDDAAVAAFANGGALWERATFTIRAENGKSFVIDRLYRDALRHGVGSTADAKGQLALMLYADSDNPRLFPAAPDEREHGPEKTFPLGRIIHNAGPGEQVERLSKAGERSRDWTVANTRISGGKEDNKPTRVDFLAYVREKAGDAAAAETEQQLCTADGLVRPGLDKTYTFIVDHNEKDADQ